MPYPPGRPIPPPPDLAHFWAGFGRVGECLEWQRGTDSDGYGQVRYGGVAYRTHRVAWVLTHGPIPPETPFVLHHCDNPPCGDDEHLYLGDQPQNLADARNRGRWKNQNTDKEVCINGHEFTEENTIRRPGRSGRECRICNREATRRRRGRSR